MPKFHSNRLQVGDHVVFDASSLSGAGVVVETLENDYVRVRWGDFKYATTHRRHSLERSDTAYITPVW